MADETTPFYSVDKIVEFMKSGGEGTAGIRDLNHGLLEDDMSVPTNGRSFASFRQNVDPDMCMALLIFNGMEWEFAAMPYRNRDVAEQLGDLVNGEDQEEILEVPSYNNDTIPVKDRWYKIEMGTGLSEDFPQAKHYPYGEFIGKVIDKTTGQILEHVPLMKTKKDHAFSKRNVVAATYLHELANFKQKADEVPIGGTMFETDTDISMCVNMLDELTSEKHANGVGRGFGKALVYFAVQIVRRDLGKNAKGLIARTENKETGGKRETRYSWYMRMGDRVEKGKEQTQPDVWGQEIEGILPRILNYWYAVSNSKDDGVPTTGHTHDFGVYIDDVLAILVGESVSGKGTLDAELFKTIPGFIRALNFYTKVCGVIVCVDKVVLIYAYFDRTDCTKIKVKSCQFGYARGHTFPSTIMKILYRIAHMLNTVLEEAFHTQAEIIFTRALDVTFDRPDSAGLNRYASVYGIYTGLLFDQFISDNYPLYYKVVHASTLSEVEKRQIAATVAAPKQRQGKKRRHEADR